LFATLSLTKYGRELLENREYRYTSPVFTLNEDGTVADLHSVALTNVPAFKGHITPVINSESTEEILIEKDILKMNKDELRELIISIISELKEAEKIAEVKEEIKEEIVENKCSNEMKEVVSNEETTEEISEETVEEVETEKVEEPKEIIKEKEEDEVIKIEALNSAPSISLGNEPIWKKLTGKEFREWCSKHPNGI
jgi:phage I-like protein